LKKKSKIGKFQWADLEMAGQHYIDKVSLAKIGVGFGVSRQRVHQRIARLRKALAA
jgi:predicted DNA-binding protein YlxM (UPF0122 family)